MRRWLAPPLLVLAALTALVAVAMVPRGVVRTTAAQAVAAPAPAEQTELTAPGERVHLPGVRAVVGKEEDEADASVDQQPALEVALAGAADQPGLAEAASDPVPAPAERGAAPAGARAPPHSV